MRQLIYLLCSIPFLGVSQISFEKELDSVNSKKEAEVFIESNKNTKGKILTFNKEKHKTRLANELFKLSKGGKKIIKSDYKTTYYKVLSKDKVIHERVNYILFDSAEKSLSEINMLRDEIILKHKDGYDFKTLAKYYSMDINAKKGGDSGWFEDEVMPSKFEQEVKNHNINDIFRVDIAKDNAYYVVLKSHEPKTIEEITVLKFSETRN